MAHNLNIIDGKAALAYYGESPWHGLGTRVQQAMTSLEVLELAGLDWEVEKVALKTNDESAIDTHVAIRRMDTGTILSVVGSGYKPIQNTESLSIMDAMVGSSEAMYHTAGALGQGERIWVLAKLPQSLVVVGDDVVDQYLLLANAFDGTLALTMLFTPVRVVCQNTLTAALGNAFGSRKRRLSNGIYIRHSESANVRIDEARKVLGISARYFEQAGEKYRAMTAKQVNDAMLKEYLTAVFPLTLTDPEDAERVESATNRQKAPHETVAHLYAEGAGNRLPGVQGTVWAAYNAAVEWVDHVNVLTQKGELKKNALESALFGTGMQTRQRAFDEALALLN